MKTLYLRAPPETPLEGQGAHACIGPTTCGVCQAIARFNDELRDWHIRRMTLCVLEEAGLIKVKMQ